MTWEELKEYVELNYHNPRITIAVCSDHICCSGLMFTDKGEVIRLLNVEYPYAKSPRIRKKISFEQMKQVIDGLYGDLRNDRNSRL